jgi:hypothetical protein
MTRIQPPIFTSLIPSKATYTDVNTGSDDTKFITSYALSSSYYATGWTPANETWTYASATTFTIATDKTGKYGKGSKLLLFNDSQNKYFYVTSCTYSSPNSTVTVTGEIDLAAGTIINNYFSQAECPVGFKNGVMYYYAKAHANSTQALSANTPATLTCDDEEYDPNSNYNTSTYKYTTPITGYYRVTGRCKGANLAANERIFLTTVGGTGAGDGTDVQATGTGSYIASMVTLVVYATKGTELYVQVTTTSGADTQVDSSISVWQIFEFIHL